MDGQMYGQTENLPILQDFVPYRGRCPASPMKAKEKVERGKGTADHLMPLGCFLDVSMHHYMRLVWSMGLSILLLVC